MMFRFPLARALAPLIVFAACTPPTPATDAGPDDGEGLEAVCTEKTEVPCQDESFENLEMFDNVTDGVVEEISGGPDFVHHVDATAGGFGNINESYNYVRFTDDGLEKVEISDSDAFDSLDWDMAFQRFIVRLNSGVSGPSCVTAARTATGTEFDDVSSVPDGLTFNAEQYFDEEADCTLQEDGSGLGSPGVVLQSYWEYPGCVKMTGNVYVVQLASGRHVKLQILAYYSDQDACDIDGAPIAGTSGQMKFKWSWLD